MKSSEIALKMSFYLSFHVCDLFPMGVAFLSKEQLKNNFKKYPAKPMPRVHVWEVFEGYNNHSVLFVKDKTKEAEIRVFKLPF